MKKSFENLTVFLLLLPLVWINSPETHDWGDDFAAYIHQAENILSGKEMGDTGYLYNPDYYRLAPPSYPVGFPIMLAMWIGLFGNSIGGLVLFMSLLLILFGIGFYKVMRFRFPPAVAMAALLITFYNPWMIIFKVEVIADMPFAMLIAWSVVAYRRAIDSRSKLLWRWSVCALLVTWSILTKTIGWVMPIAFGLDILNRFRRDRSIGPLVGLGYLSALTFGLTWIVAHLWLPAPGDHLEHFSRIAADEGGYLGALLPNLNEYPDIYKYFFARELGDLAFIANTTGSMLLSFAVIGMIVRWIRKGIEVEDWVFLGLFGALLLFPITNGFRYLLPAYVFLLGFSIYGLGLLPWHYALRRWLPILGVLIMWGQYTRGWSKIARLPDEREGPYLEAYQPLHDRIRQIASEHPDAVFAAAKPRAFSYLDGVDAFSIKPDLSPDDAKEAVLRLAGSRPLYLIQVDRTPHPAIDDLLLHGTETSDRMYEVEGPWPLTIIPPSPALIDSASVIRDSITR